jgi:hypothetical protein
VFGSFFLLGTAATSGIGFAQTAPTSFDLNKSQVFAGGTGVTGSQCYLITIADGTPGMVVGIKYTRNGNPGRFQIVLDGSLHPDNPSQFCVSRTDSTGTYTFTDIKNTAVSDLMSDADWNPLNPTQPPNQGHTLTLEVRPPKPWSFAVTPSNIVAGQDAFAIHVENGQSIKVLIEYTYMGMASTTDPDLNVSGDVTFNAVDCIPPGLYTYTRVRNFSDNIDDDAWLVLSNKTLTVVSAPAGSLIPVSAPLGWNGTLTVTGRNLCGVSMAPVLGAQAWPGLTLSNPQSPLPYNSASADLIIAPNATVASGTIVVTASYGQITLPFSVTNNAGPILQSVSPPSAMQGAAGVITITGQNLASATLSRSGITFSNYSYPAPPGTQVIANFSVGATASLNGDLVVQNSVGSTTRSFQVFAPGTVFWKKDYIQDENGRVVATAEVNPSNPTDSPPQTPTNLVASVNAPSQIHLSWTNGGNTTFFGIERKRSTEANYTLTSAVPSYIVSFDDGGLPPAIYNYRVRAYNGATASPPSNVATQTITDTTDTTPPSTPIGLQAMALNSTQVQLNWTASTDNVAVHHYRIERFSNAGPVELDTPSAATSYRDTVAPNIAYRYRVRALDAAGNLSAYGNRDLAVTIVFQDDPIIPNATSIQAQHLYQLRQAVNAVRATAGLAPTIWAEPSLTGVAVKATHIIELRNSLSPALTSFTFGFSPPGYTDTLTPNATPIRAVHVQELRNYMK